MLKTKSIARIVRVMGYGMSCPIHIIADDDKDYILKTKIVTLDGNENVQISAKELFAEIFSYIYLKTLNASYIPNACLLDVTDETLQLVQKFANGSEREKQALQNLTHSEGLNLGVEYIKDANKIFSINDFSQDFIKKTINYDARLMNTDRDVENPNILQDLSDKKWLIDFGLAFDTLILFDNFNSTTGLFSETANETYFDKCCFVTYIFDENIRKNTTLLKDTISSGTIKNIVDYVCGVINLLDNSQKIHLAQIIERRQNSKRILCA